MRIVEVNNLTSKIKDGIVNVGMKAFGKGMTEEEIIDHVLPMDKIYVAVDEKIIGFATAKIKDDLVYLGGTAVLPKMQGNGLYEAFALRRIELALSANKREVTLRTQNPIIEFGVLRALDTLASIDMIGKYYTDRSISQGIYGRRLTTEIPKSKCHRLNDVYRDLNYDRGDAFNLRFKLQPFFCERV